MKKGFTLVELSIVLVIIGLLIGGILVGQSLIESVKIQGFVRQITQYDAAVILFEDKYRGLPGDVRALNSTADNNGLIEDNGGGTQDTDKFENEVANFWANLSQTGFQPDNAIYDTAAASRITPGVNTPKIDGFEDVVVLAHYWIGGVFTTGNRYHFSKTTRAAGQSWIGNELAAFRPVDALSIDQKLDDGSASAGFVRGNSGSGLGPNDCGVVFGGVTGAYTVDETDEACILFVEIGGSI